MHYPLTDIHAHFEINRPARYQNIAKRNYYHRRTDRRTDARTDGQTDGQTSRTTTIGSFFEKKKKLLKTTQKHIIGVKSSKSLKYKNQNTGISNNIPIFFFI